ncbi:MAG: sodium:proton antiporter [Gammaproteobacteria bacterium]|nr:MAG: sodium:proton antiporter [Gammaproteobacteria bacterium]
MELVNVAAILVSIAALMAYVNYRFIGLPSAIGLMVISLCLSVGLIILSKLGMVVITESARLLIDKVDFSVTLLHGMLSFLLFAGALHININDLARFKWVIGLMATAGVMVSALIISTLMWWLLGLLGLPIPFIYCLLFGALISPTDPIAVLGILKSAGVPKNLEIKIAGESLFNDGVGVVLFIAILGIATGGQEVNAMNITILFLEEAVGGIILGFVLGSMAFYLLKDVDNYPVEILLTLALVMGGYSLAIAIHTSGPITMVVAGLLIGNHGRRYAMSDKTREHLDTFWELVDEILNAVLFVLIGFELLIISFSPSSIYAGLLAIPVVLLARFLSVSFPIKLMSLKQQFSPGSIRVLTWGGLRGGISVALVLSIPAGEARELLLTITYIVVIFSVIVQGLSIERVVKRWCD